MQESLDASLVRIRTTDGRVVGAGFLVGERQVLSCAHVVSQALDLVNHPLDLPQGLVSLDFPLIPPRTLLTAKVVLWCPPLSDGRGDIAERQQQEAQQRRRYTRRNVLIGLAGLGLTATALTVSGIWFGNRSLPPLPLPYTYRGHTGSVLSVVWSPEGKRLASASDDTTVQVWLWITS